MRLLELFEAKAKPKVATTVPRNYVAKNAPTSGAGSHTKNKHSRKEKHKSAKEES